jgi:hypothetical protein
MKAYTIKKQILVLEFESKKEQNLSMVRFQEFYEGKPGIKGQKFNWELFIDKYSTDEGLLDYFSFWDGFNFPSSIIDEFISLNPETYQREKEIINQSKELEPNCPGYVISYVQGDETTKNHELSHAFYFLDEEYKNKSIDIIKTIPKDHLISLFKDLTALGYLPHIINDEIIAYLVGFDQDEFDKYFSIRKQAVQKQIEQLQALFNQKKEEQNQIEELNEHLVENTEQRTQTAE